MDRWSLAYSVPPQDGQTAFAKTIRSMELQVAISAVSVVSSAFPIRMQLQGLPRDTPRIRDGFVRQARRRDRGKVIGKAVLAVSYTHLRAHETRHDLVCRLLL